MLVSRMSQNTSFNNTATKRPPSAENQFLLKESAPRNGSTPRGTRKNADYYEKQPLFERATAEPVRLTPAWEETNLPNDELNFKGVTMEQAVLEMNPPTDRLRLVYITLLLHGIGTLMPWNMFITAKAYFEDYKLAGTPYVANFLPYVAFAAQIPNLLLNWINIFIPMGVGGSLTTRIVWSILVEVVVFILTVILAMCDSSQWPEVFFTVTMITVVILNMANGVYQNTVYGMAAKLPFKYTGAVILGANISGTFTAIINVVSKFMSPNERTAAIYYFITALFILLACFDTYFALPLNRFYRYHELIYEKEQQAKRKQNLGAVTYTPFCTILKQCLPQCFNVFFVFFVTLTIFPAVHSEIQMTDENFFTGVRYYSDVTCFLTFNIGAMLGSTLATWITWPSPKYLVLPVVLRVLFIPFFLVCNYRPEGTRYISVFINSDWGYWIGAVFMALSSGYFSSVAMMYCPRSVEPQYASTAGMFGAASLITGIFGGILFTLLMPWFVTTTLWDLL
ncbi:equilibrative nucleoside transporter 1 isoform X1 [Periplaneta americana]|uniref:equilibrative nucleoside transporter 1 isoform X1 n=2 Tax=Periplaneta americana TaxID=6978 RepID=UPI0037E7C86D